MQLSLVKTYRFYLFIFFIAFCFPGIAKAEDFFLEPVVQGYSLEDAIMAVKEKDTYYIDIEQLAEVLEFKLDYNLPNLQGSFLGQDFTIDTRNLPPDSYKLINGKYYFSIFLYEAILPIKMTVDPFEMQLKITSDKELPLTQKLMSEKRKQNMGPIPQHDPFSNYQFDNRMLSTPVVDVTYRNNYNINDYNGENEKRWDSNYYQVDMGMLLGGFDTSASFFGDSDTNNYNPRARITVGRTFLDEPKNALNLTSFEAGDVTGFNSTLFNNSANGRGLYASSFKDLVLSADKTINLSGPLSAGWDAELYQNGQLIGFRQPGVNGQYLFSNIPVTYGLNAFKIVFYGPYGEIQTEERNYYSGTSPVKPGEFGYTLNAYQKDHYLFEKNEPYLNDSNKSTLDFTGYYGINDNVTLIGGVTQTPNEETDENMNFGTAGLQFIFDGASFQYNSLYDFTNQTTGHHFDIQGDVSIGTIFARYDYYGDLQAPIAFYNDEYMRDIAEIRFSGFVPSLSLPYYISYVERNSLEGEKTQEIHTRISPSFMTYYNLSIENVWSKDETETMDDIIVLLQAQYGDLGLHSQVNYRVEPDNYIHSLNQQVDYRWDKYTYFQANWEHDMRSQYSDLSDLDTLSLSAGHLFPIGGFTLALSADTDKNAAISLTYNMSFGKIPDENRLFTNAQNKMSERSAIYAKVVDEEDKPVVGTKIQVSGLQNPVITDENGEALIADIEPYQKTILTVDTGSVEDVALIPEFENKKLVLRPGTVLPLKIPFAHKGGIEGYIESNEPAYSYKVALLNAKGDAVATKTPEEDGSFIFDEVNYGKYKLVISNAENKMLKEENIDLHEAFYSMTQPIQLASK